MDLIPDVDYAAVAAAASAQRDEPEALAEHLSAAWAAAYRSRIPESFLLEFDSDGARFLFDLASSVGAAQADRTVAAWGRSRPAPRPRDVSYQRGYPSPRGRAVRRLDKGHMVAHAAGGTFGPNMFPQDRDLNRGWSADGRRYRALEREIAATPGTFFFCCLLYADDSDFPASIDLGVLRPSALHVERFRCPVSPNLVRQHAADLRRRPAGCLTESGPRWLFSRRCLIQVGPRWPFSPLMFPGDVRSFHDVTTDLAGAGAAGRLGRVWPQY